MTTFLFDLDGTITKQELLPEIAKKLGLEEEIRKLTQLTIEGMIPFSESIKRRVDILKRVDVEEVKAIVQQIPLHEKILTFLRKNWQRCFIVTGNLDVWIGDLCKMIGIPAYTSIGSMDNGKLSGIHHILDKRTVAAELLPKVERLVSIGEGHADAGMMELSEVRVAWGAVHKPAQSVLEIATHAIYDEDTLCRFLERL